MPEADGSSGEGRDTLERVRDAATSLPGASPGRRGGRRRDADFIDAVYGNFPLMLA